jgi:hypothetical protein
MTRSWPQAEQRPGRRMHTLQYQSSPPRWSVRSGLPHVTQTGGEITTAPALRSAISRSPTTRGAGD